MLTHTYPHKPLIRGKLKWPYAITRLTTHFMWAQISNLVICKFRKSMIIHDTECPYWDQVSLNNTNQTKQQMEQSYKVAYSLTLLLNLAALAEPWKQLQEEKMSSGSWIWVTEFMSNSCASSNTCSSLNCWERGKNGTVWWQTELCG